MAEWRIIRGWSDEELMERLRALSSVARNFTERDEDMTPERGWKRQYSRSLVAREKPGPAERGGPFERLSVVLRNYEFSDPRIVTAHFNPEEQFEGRRFLLELKVPGLRYLCGTVVAAVREESPEGSPVYGFRYETLEGHIERGWEWFLVRKDQKTGEIEFSIEARWKEGEFPNFWSRIGFDLVGRRMQKRWHRHAHRRMTILSSQPMEVLERQGRGGLAHEGPEILFEFD